MGRKAKLAVKKIVRHAAKIVKKDIRSLKHQGKKIGLRVHIKMNCKCLPKIKSLHGRHHFKRHHFKRHHFKRHHFKRHHKRHHKVHHKRHHHRRHHRRHHRVLKVGKKDTKSTTKPVNPKKANKADGKDARILAPLKKMLELN